MQISVKGVEFGEYIYSKCTYFKTFLSKQEYLEDKKTPEYSKYLRYLAIVHLVVSHTNKKGDIIKEEEVLFPFYRSSGNNSGKVKGDWYPILGIYFIDDEDLFPLWLKLLLVDTTRQNPKIRPNVMAKTRLHNELDISNGWLMKSCFFNLERLNSNLPIGYGSSKNSFLYLVAKEFLERNFVKVKDSLSYEDSLEFTKNFNLKIYSQDQEVFKDFLFTMLNASKDKYTKIEQTIKEDFLEIEQVNAIEKAKNSSMFRQIPLLYQYINQFEKAI